MWAYKLYLYKAWLKYKGGIKEWNIFRKGLEEGLKRLMFYT